MSFRELVFFLVCRKTLLPQNALQPWDLLRFSVKTMGIQIVCDVLVVSGFSHSCVLFTTPERHDKCILEAWRRWDLGAAAGVGPGVAWAARRGNRK